MKNLLIVLACLLWLGSTDIANYFYPTTSEYDVNGFWELKKILYSVIMFLLLIRINNISSLFFSVVSITFGGFLIEDIQDRFFGTKEFEWNDLLVLLITLLVITVKIKKHANSNKNNIFYINNLFRNKRNE